MILQINRDQAQFFYSFRFEQMVLPALKLLDIAAASESPRIQNNGAYLPAHRPHAHNREYASHCA